jgi:hypothetical protein
LFTEGLALVALLTHSVGEEDAETCILEEGWRRIYEVLRIKAS